MLMHIYFGLRSWLWSHSPGFEICSFIPSLTLDKLQPVGEEELPDCSVHYIKHVYFFFLFLSFFFLLFLGLLLQHMEVPKLGVESELEPAA